MISDSPYDSEELVLKPSTGTVSGVVAGMLMLILIWALSPVSGLSVGTLLTHVGSMMTSSSDKSSITVAVGLVVHLMTAGLLGLLYALCQRRIVIHGLVGVGLLFGFVMWVISTVIVGWLLDETARVVLRSWPWLLASLLFGLVLASVAVWQESRQPREQLVAPRD